MTDHESLLPAATIAALYVTSGGSYEGRPKMTPERPLSTHPVPATPTTTNREEP